MKNFIIYLLMLLYNSILVAQIIKTEVSRVGTKMSFYPNACGNTIPEAQNKLNFCDGADNLGVVDKSLGLNDNRVLRMLANHQNQDEVFITNNGVSIKKTDGSWENIPNIAIPTFNAQNQPTNQGSIRNGIVLPNGQLLLSGNNFSGVSYNRATKEITAFNIGINRRIELFAFDSVNNLTWIIAFEGSTRYLYSYNGLSLNEIGAIPLLQNVNIAVSSTNMQYYNDFVYVGNFNGLFKISVNDTNNATKYDANSTPALPFTAVNDIKIGNNNNLWLAQSSGIDGALVQFNIPNETFTEYKLARENNPNSFIRFQKLAINQNDEVWAVSNDYDGLVQLTFGGIVDFTRHSRTDINNSGTAYQAKPNNVYYANGQYYFTINASASSNSENNEVIIRNGSVWSGINDNESGNISAEMTRDFNLILPDSNSNTWWFGTTGLILKRDENDIFQRVEMPNLSSSAVIDGNNNAIVRGGNPSEIRKVDFNTNPSIQSAFNIATNMVWYNGAAWVFDRNQKKIDVYKNDNLLTTYNLEDSYQNFFEFTIDESGIAWFVRISSNDLIISRYNPVTDSTESETRTDAIGALRKVIAGPNNSIWIIGETGIVYFNGTDYFPLLSTNYSEINRVSNAIVDANGKLHLLSIDSASLVTVENADTTPIITRTILENNGSILPAFDFYRPNELALDSNGDLWIHSSRQVSFKIVDNDTSTQFVLSTRENQLTIEITIVYPNPSKDRIFVKSIEPIKELAIFNLTGTKVAHNKNQSEIKVNQLTRGIYVLMIRVKNNFITKKIVVE